MAVDGKLIILNELGELILVRANSERYEELSRTRVLGGELVWTPPILHRGRLYLRNHSRAVCVYVGDPELLAETETPVLTVNDVPQSEYRDIAAELLGVEPEYAFDLPSGEWLTRWFWISLALLAGSRLVAYPIDCWLNRKQPDPVTRDPVARKSYIVIAFVVGAISTTLLGRWTQEFTFTWPVCIYIAFDGLCGSVKLKREKDRKFRERLMTWLQVAMFLGVCFVYFMMCRRLSLVFEWVFLVGFACAIPFSILAARCRRQCGWKQSLLSYVCELLSFAAFYWSAVGYLYHGR